MNTDNNWINENDEQCTILFDVIVKSTDKYTAFNCENAQIHVSCYAYFNSGVFTFNGHLNRWLLFIYNIFMKLMFLLLLLLQSLRGNWLSKTFSDAPNQSIQQTVSNFRQLFTRNIKLNKKFIFISSKWFRPIRSMKTPKSQQTTDKRLDFIFITRCSLSYYYPFKSIEWSLNDLLFMVLQFEQIVFLFCFRKNFFFLSFLVSFFGE